MASETIQFARPPSYPKDGTYADLLYWHLFIWGTRPGGSVTERGADRWTEREFRTKIFGANDAQESEAKIYKSWIGDGKSPHPPGPDFWPPIARALFDGEPQYEVWANDLDLARKRSKGKGNNVKTITLEAALAELARAGLTTQSTAPLGSKDADTTTAQNHFAAAAKENVALVVHRLTEYFVGRVDDIGAIDQFVSNRMAGGSEGLLVITAPPGYGKSALAAHWCQQAEHMAHRRVAKHFCAISAGDATTSLANIYANLHRQVAQALGEPIDQSSSFDALAAMLRKPMPEGMELMVWLDGIDEAESKVACFLPSNLGERICVIISARADEGTTPAYLEPWLTEAMAIAHHPVRHGLGKLSLSDVKALVGGVFARAGLTAPEGLAQRIFDASDEGYALFVRNMAETAIETAKEGRNIDLGDAPETLRGYAESELRRLESLTQWADLQSLFAFLAIAREAVNIEEIPALLGKRIFPSNLPRQLVRWLSVVEFPRRERPALLSLAHPLLAQVFGQALGYQRHRAIVDLCDTILAQTFTQWPRYAWRHLPQHLLDAGRITEAAALMSDLDFISARFAAVGAEAAPRLMAADWTAWYDVERPKIFDAAYSVDTMRHLRFWCGKDTQLSDLGSQGIANAWQQMLHDAGLGPRSAHASLVHPRPYAPDTIDNLYTEDDNWIEGVAALSDGSGFLSRTTGGKLQLWEPTAKEHEILYGRQSGVTGALAYRDGFLSWGDDYALKQWGRDGTEGPMFDGHTRQVIGAQVLADGAGFLSWSADGTLRLWNADGTAGPILSGHKWGVEGALILEEARGFLSWGLDGTLRLWDSNGGQGPVLHGHDSAIKGALALANGTGFLSWSADGSLRLWGANGEQGPVLRGHDDAVTGALELAGGAGFLSWGEDGALRQWGSAGENSTILHRHDSWVSNAIELSNGTGFVSSGADNTLRLWRPGEAMSEVLHDHWGSMLELPDIASFLSWGSDGTLRLWSNKGQLQNSWTSPNGRIGHVEPFGEPNHYLVLFGGEVGIVHLAQ